MVSVECQRCTRCDDVLMPSELRGGPPNLCLSCRRLDTVPVRVSHRKLLRCPECRAQIRTDTLGLLNDGVVPVRCPNCRHEFPARVFVSFTFESPPLTSASAQKNDTAQKVT